MTRWLCPLMLVLLAHICLPGCSTTHEITSDGSSMCMVVVYHGYPVAGAPLVVRPCDPRQNRQWSLQNGQISGVGGFCLDVAGGEARDGAAVVYTPCSGAPSQHWTAVNGAIVGIGGKCLDIGGGRPDDMANLIITPCSGSPSQSWQLH
jgi:hypothetical protein